MATLTMSAVARAKRGYHGDGDGLYLRVGPPSAKSPAGSKSWVFRYRVDGRLHDMGLGSLSTLNLAEAREAALACRKELLAFRPGKAEHPLDTRKADQAARRVEAAKAMTFRECAEAYIKSHEP